MNPLVRQHAVASALVHPAPRSVYPPLLPLPQFSSPVRCALDSCPDGFLDVRRSSICSHSRNRVWGDLRRDQGPRKEEMTSFPRSALYPQRGAREPAIRVVWCGGGKGLCPQPAFRRYLLLGRCSRNPFPGRHLSFALPKGFRSTHHSLTGLSLQNAEQGSVSRDCVFFFLTLF